jgi:hypothetical protein
LRRGQNLLSHLGHAISPREPALEPDEETSILCATQGIEPCHF